MIRPFYSKFAAHSLSRAAAIVPTEGLVSLGRGDPFTQ